MKWAIIAVCALLCIAVIIIFFPIVVRNGLIDLDETRTEAWSQIDVQLQRRADLVPNLVATVKGYASHEDKIFTGIAEARSRMLAARTPTTKAAAAGALSSVLGRLLAISENYPQLKADSTFIRLQDELAGTENRISVARIRYNSTVKTYNAAIRKFPGHLFAPDMGLEKGEFFEPPEGQNIRDVPEVSF